MNTMRISFVLSLVVLSSVSFAQSDRFYKEGLRIGKELCFSENSSYGKSPADRYPIMNGIIKTFSTYEPSSTQFKKAFSEFKKVAQGIKKASSESNSLNAPLIKAFAEVVIEAKSIGQVFMAIGTKIKHSGMASINFLGNLQLTSNSQAYAHGKDIAKHLCTLIIDHVAQRSSESAATELQMTAKALMMHFMMSVDRKGFPNNPAVLSEIFNTINGFKAGLKEYPLKAKLASFKPMKAILMRFIHAQLLVLASMPEESLHAKSPVADVCGDAFINCGQELEAIS